MRAEMKNNTDAVYEEVKKCGALWMYIVRNSPRADMMSEPLQTERELCFHSYEA